MITTADLLPSEIAENETDPYVEAMAEFEDEVQTLDLEPWIVERLKNSEREVNVRLSYSLPGSGHSVVSGFRVLQSTARGPALGPLFIAPEISLNRVRASAMKTTWQCGLLDLPFGGSSGALVCDPQNLSEVELKTIVQAYIETLGGMIGRFEDIVIPREGCNCKIAVWMMESCGRHGGMPDFSAVVGKPGASWGLPSCAVATEGVVFLMNEILSERGASLNHQRVIVQGFGQTGSAIAASAYAMGGRVVGLADISGALYREDGIRLQDVESYFRSGGMLYGFPDADAVSNADLLEAPADILVLAARENQITRTNAEHVRARMLIEVAEGAISTAGLEILDEREIAVVPELLANAGSLAGAFLEWKQGMHFCRLAQDEIQDSLKRRMANMWSDLRQFRGSGNLRHKALQLGITRVAEAVRSLQ
jgi:glutamate dehydrogenase/leucine dehydrogenase